MKKSAKGRKNCFIGRNCGASCVSKEDNCRDGSEETKAMAKKLIAKFKSNTKIKTQAPTFPPSTLKKIADVTKKKHALIDINLGNAPHPLFKLLKPTAAEVKAALKAGLKDFGFDSLKAKKYLQQDGKDFFTGGTLTKRGATEHLLIPASKGGKREAGNIVLTNSLIAERLKGLTQEQAHKGALLGIKQAAEPIVKPTVGPIKSASLRKLDQLHTAREKVFNKGLDPKTKLAEKIKFFDASKAVDAKIEREFEKAFNKATARFTDSQIESAYVNARIDKPVRNTSAHEEGIKAYLKIHGTLPKTLQAIRYDANLDRPYATSNTVVLGPSATKGQVMHEIGHHREFSNAEIKAKAVAFRLAHASSDVLELLNDITKTNHYDKTEKAYRGNFTVPYIGKYYPGGQTEVTSSGYEMLRSPLSFSAAYSSQPGKYLLDFILNQLEDKT